jgi:ribosomal protein S18 acetylase RimI-like enzyme
MSDRFLARQAQESVVAELSDLVPANPFATVAYFESRRQSGWATWLLAKRSPRGGLEYGCGAFMKTRGWNRKLEIPSLPAVPANSPFWDDLMAFCRRHCITKLEIDTFGSPAGVTIPTFDTCRARRRCEYVLDLSLDLDAQIDRRHKSHLNKARRAGLVVRRTRSIEAVPAHREMIGCSMDRRRARGEDVPSVSASRGFATLLQSGVGELYQVLEGETVLASGLVLRAPEGAYFHSRGTSPGGMAVGASHFLVRQIMAQLKAEGVQSFNLGGADEGSGLARFKKRFGASAVHLPSATYLLGPSWVREANRAIELVRADPRRLLRSLSGRVSRFVVFAAAVDAIVSPDLPADVVVRGLSDEDLRRLPVEDPQFRTRPLLRVAGFGASYAYGVFVDGRLTHIAWFLPATATEKDVPRLMTLRAGEAEITASETLPEFRGRGIYPLAIQSLIEEAQHCGARRIIMKAAANDYALQSGIEKAGLTRMGSIILIVLPIINRQVAWRSFR